MTTLAPLFLNGSSVMRTTMKAWLVSNFGKISLPTTELAVIERLQNRCRLF